MDNTQSNFPLLKTTKPKKKRSSQANALVQDLYDKRFSGCTKISLGSRNQKREYSDQQDIEKSFGALEEFSSLDTEEKAKEIFEEFAEATHDPDTEVKDGLLNLLFNYSKIDFKDCDWAIIATAIASMDAKSKAKVIVTMRMYLLNLYPCEQWKKESDQLINGRYLSLISRNKKVNGHNVRQQVDLKIFITIIGDVRSTIAFILGAELPSEFKTDIESLIEAGEDLEKVEFESDNQEFETDLEKIFSLSETRAREEDIFYFKKYSVQKKMSEVSLDTGDTVESFETNYVVFIPNLGVGAAVHAVRALLAYVTRLEDKLSFQMTEDETYKYPESFKDIEDSLKALQGNLAPLKKIATLISNITKLKLKQNGQLLRPDDMRKLPNLQEFWKMHDQSTYISHGRSRIKSSKIKKATSIGQKITEYSKALRAEQMKFFTQGASEMQAAVIKLVLNEMNNLVTRDTRKNLWAMWLQDSTGAGKSLIKRQYEEFRRRTGYCDTQNSTFKMHQWVPMHTQYKYLDKLPENIQNEIPNCSRLIDIAKQQSKCLVLGLHQEIEILNQEIRGILSGDTLITTRKISIIDTCCNRWNQITRSKDSKDDQMKNMSKVSAFIKMRMDINRDDLSPLILIPYIVTDLWYRNTICNIKSDLAEWRNRLSIVARRDIRIRAGVKWDTDITEIAYAQICDQHFGEIESSVNDGYTIEMIKKKVLAEGGGDFDQETRAMLKKAGVNLDLVKNVIRKKTKDYLELKKRTSSELRWNSWVNRQIDHFNKGVDGLKRKMVNAMKKSFKRPNDGRTTGDFKKKEWNKYTQSVVNAFVRPLLQGLLSYPQDVPNGEARIATFATDLLTIAACHLNNIDFESYTDQNLVSLTFKFEQDTYSCDQWGARMVIAMVVKADLSIGSFYGEIDKLALLSMNNSDFREIFTAKRSSYLQNDSHPDPLDDNGEAALLIMALGVLASNSDEEPSVEGSEQED